MKIRRKKVQATTNNITTGIINLINSEPHCFAFRCDNGAVFDPVLQVFRKKRKGDAGKSDVVACVYGRFLAVEIKNCATLDKQSEDQKIWMHKVGAADGLYVIAESYEYFETTLWPIVKQCMKR